MKVILLTSEQADQVRGRHGKYSALDPILADNGMYILPTDVLDDPEHAEVLKDLEGCKFAEVQIREIIDLNLPDGPNGKLSQVLSVKEISPVSITAEKIMTAKPVYEEVKPMLK